MIYNSGVFCRCSLFRYQLQSVPGDDCGGSGWHPEQGVRGAVGLSDLVQVENIMKVFNINIGHYLLTSIISSD